MEKGNKQFIFAVLAVLAVGAALFFALRTDTINTTETGVKRFNSYAELKDFLNENRQQSYSYGYFGGSVLAEGIVMKTSVSDFSVSTTTGGAIDSSPDYSKTNIQVEGVDEADIVKNDGKYIYTVAGNNVVIVKAYPAADAKIVSEIKLEGTPTEILVNRDKLVVFGQHYDYANIEPEPVSGVAKSAIASRPYYRSGTAYTYIKVYDLKERSNPAKTRDIKITGNYHDSRMIGDYVYAVVNMPVNDYDRPILPMIEEDGVKRKIAVQDIYYFPVPDYSYNYINIIGLNTQDAEEKYTSQTYLSGSTQNLFVSMNNLYVTHTKTNYYDTPKRILENVLIPAVPQKIANDIAAIEASNSSDKWQLIETTINSYLNTLNESEREELERKAEKNRQEFEQRMAKEREKTVIHKIAINDGKIEYKGQGEVPGTVLNQFSMDEHNGYFRIATTTGNLWSRGADIAKNHIYIMDENMKIKGMVEDLAPGERIYSARFMGDRAYLVTFKKVDPLFVVDLKDPSNPKVLGKLKIPGYSDYLHPYDENHIIGIGKEAAEAEQGDFAWYQGIKLALFDVSDPENPREISKFNIGDRGTESYALEDHKAFLFDRKKNLLVIPVLLAEIDESKYSGKLPANTYGDYVFQGAYVFNLDTENGFKLKGRITHVEDDSLKKSGYYYYSNSSVKRSLYIGDVLYTLSDRLIKMNDLDNMEEVNKVELPASQTREVVFY